MILNKVIPFKLIFLGGGSISGKFEEAAAPNITGTSNAGAFNFGACTGALYGGGSASRQDTGGNDYWRTGGVCIDASRVSNIYGRKGNVLFPKHYTGKWFIKFE